MVDWDELDYDYFSRWRNDGTWQKIVDALRAQVRVAAGREPSPSAAVIDSQTVKTTEVGGEHGYDGGKKISGRKRHFLVDTLGLLLWWSSPPTCRKRANRRGSGTGLWSKERKRLSQKIRSQCGSQRPPYQPKRRYRHGESAPFLEARVGPDWCSGGFHTHYLRNHNERLIGSQGMPNSGRWAHPDFGALKSYPVSCFSEFPSACNWTIPRTYWQGNGENRLDGQSQLAACRCSGREGAAKNFSTLGLSIGNRVCRRPGGVAGQLECELGQREGMIGHAVSSHREGDGRGLPVTAASGGRTSGRYRPCAFSPPFAWGGGRGGRRDDRAGRP